MGDGAAPLPNPAGRPRKTRQWLRSHVPDASACIVRTVTSQLNCYSDHNVTDFVWSLWHGRWGCPASQSCRAAPQDPRVLRSLTRPSWVGSIRMFEMTQPVSQRNSWRPFRATHARFNCNPRSCTPRLRDCEKRDYGCKQTSTRAVSSNSGTDEKRTDH